MDGNPIESLNLSWWRSQIGYVAQQPLLFPGTIRYNIACGKPGATNEEVEEAAKAACAHEFITTQLVDGYDTYYSGASIQLSKNDRFVMEFLIDICELTCLFPLVVFSNIRWWSDAGKLNWWLTCEFVVRLCYSDKMC